MNQPPSQGHILCLLFLAPFIYFKVSTLIQLCLLVFLFTEFLFFFLCLSKNRLLSSVVIKTLSHIFF